jgi:MFS family permease
MAVFVEDATELPVDMDRPAIAYPSAAMRYYTLVIFILTATMGTLDRQIINILVEPIRRDLKLTDGQMGLVTGLAFALIYVVACIPVARLADRKPRRLIMGVAIGVWSVSTILCGFAQNAVQLFFARFGVGFGEAGGSAPGQALLGDIFPRHQRATVMALTLISAPAGISLGLWLGGWATQSLGWRTTFLLAGLPGLILAPVILFTLPKTRPGMADGARAGLTQEPFLTTMRQLFAQRSFPLMICAATLQTLVASGIQNWVPAFVVRSHGLDLRTIGAALGAAAGLGSLIGHIAGGPIMDFVGRRDLRWHFWLPAITAILSAGCTAAGLLAPIGFVFVMMGWQIFFSAIFGGPMLAIVMNLSSATSRATALACVFFVINLFGMGIGPWAIGLLSDALKPEFGTESLRYALLYATAACLPASFLFYRASVTYRQDIATVDARNRAA